MFRRLDLFFGQDDRKALAFAGVVCFVFSAAIDLLLAPHVHWPTTLGVASAAAVVSVFGMTVASSVTRRRLRDQDRWLETAVNNMTQGLIMFDAAERVVACNDRYIEMYGLSRDIVRPGSTLRDVVTERHAKGTLAKDPELYREELLRSIADGRTTHWVVETGDGRFISVTNKPTARGEWVATHEDITQRVISERQLEETRTFLDTVIETVPVPILVKDAKESRYILINRAGEELFGITRDWIIGKTTHDIFPDADADAITFRDRQVLESGKQLSLAEYPLHTPGNGVRVVTTKRLAIRGEDDKPLYLMGVIEDVTEKKRAEERIAHLAHHDALTDLPNRAALADHMGATLDRAAENNEQFAVLCIDLDRFKDVNDIFGHSVGDALLREVARRFSEAVDGGFLARLGGDEFIMILEQGAQPAMAEAVAARLLAAVAEEVAVEGHQLHIGLSIGVAIYPADGTDATTLLANADAALYRAKDDGRGSIRFFAPEMDKRLRERRALHNDLRAALDRGEFELYYQPQAQIGGDVIGFEALVRWQHPVRGTVPPTTFIPLAEESGMIMPLGEWVLREACREAASWARPLRIAINLSPIQFHHGDLAAMVHSILLETGLPADRLELEITEGVLIGDFSRAVSVLRRLKALGVRIAMDDFGTGYSSLSYLQSFPFDKIKIDRAFISNLHTNAQSAAIIRAVISLGRGLALPVMAEGVETEEQLEFLAREACDEVQGYLVGRPLPIAEYAGLLGRGQSSTRAFSRAG